MKLENKVAIVTGGSGGIGQGLCDRLAREGAKIVINYRSSEDEAKEVKKKVEEIGSEALLVIKRYYVNCHITLVFLKESVKSNF